MSAIQSLTPDKLSTSYVEDTFDISKVSWLSSYAWKIWEMSREELLTILELRDKEIEKLSNNLDLRTFEIEVLKYKELILQSIPNLKTNDLWELLSTPFLITNRGVPLWNYLTLEAWKKVVRKINELWTSWSEITGLDEDPRDTLKKLLWSKVINNQEIGIVLPFLEKEIRIFLDCFLNRFNEILENNVKKQQAYIDSLTWLKNRRAYDAEWRRYFNNCKLNWKDFSIIFIDIDNFKEINELYWHKWWDYVLKMISLVLKEKLDLHDYVFRIWGEEFSLLLEWIDKESAIILSKEIQKLIWSTWLYENEFSEINITVSIWISSNNEKGVDTFWTQVWLADQRAKYVKKQWRNWIEGDYIENKNQVFRKIHSDDVFDWLEWESINQISWDTLIFMNNILKERIKIESWEYNISDIPWISTVNMKHAYLLKLLFEKKWYWKNNWLMYHFDNFIANNWIDCKTRFKWVYNVLDNHYEVFCWKIKNMIISWELPELNEIKSYLFNE